MLTDVAGGGLINGRTSTATYIDANGNLQTAAANAITFENGALRHEGQATNYVIRNTDMTNAVWSLAGNSGNSSISANAAVSPSGATDAFLFTPLVLGNAPVASGAGNNRIWTQASDTGTAWAEQIYVKSAGINGSATLFLVQRATDLPVASTTITTSNTWTKLTVAGTTPTNGFRLVFSSSQACYLYLPQSEAGSRFTSVIQTTAAAATRATDSYSLPVVADRNFIQSRGIVLLKLKQRFANTATNKALLAVNTGATDMLYDNGSGGIALADGSNTATAAVGGWAANDTLLIGCCWDNRSGKMSVHVSKNSGAWVDSSDTTYDGAFPIGSNLLLASGNTDSIEFNAVKLYKTNKSFAKMQKWIKAKAAQETA